MTPLSSLLLPIVLSAVAVFVVSSLIHMVLRYHRNDFRAVPNEDAAMNAIRPLNIPPGDYAMPYSGAGMDAMKDPAFVQKWQRGPVAFFTVFPPGKMSMGSQLAQWFVFSLVVSLFAAYIASRALGPGATYIDVFRFAGATAFFCYAVATWPQSIWYRRAWSTTFKNTFDGLLYGLVTAGVFGWLWPQ
jgi:hypothetical protein